MDKQEIEDRALIKAIKRGGQGKVDYELITLEAEKSVTAVTLFPSKRIRGPKRAASSVTAITPEAGVHSVTRLEV